MSPLYHMHSDAQDHSVTIAIHSFVNNSLLISQDFPVILKRRLQNYQKILKKCLLDTTCIMMHEIFNHIHQYFTRHDRVSKVYILKITYRNEHCSTILVNVSCSCTDHALPIVLHRQISEHKSVAVYHNINVKNKAL